MNILRVAISGASGRMGRYLIQAVHKKKNIIIGAAIVRSGDSLLGIDVGNLLDMKKIGVVITDDLHKVINDFDVLIDFSHPENTLVSLKLCCKYKKFMVIGTTGFNDSAINAINMAAKEIPIVFSANFSIGINLIFHLLKPLTAIMGNYADIEIIEAHHRNKVDSPSGTALAMGQVIAHTMNWKFKDHAILKQNKYNNTKRKSNTIGFSTLRAGDIIGEHTVIFADIGERIEITHKASNRSIFAQGAIKAALWIKNKNYGLYDMKDVLNLKE